MLARKFYLGFILNEVTAESIYVFLNKNVLVMFNSVLRKLDISIQNILVFIIQSSNCYHFDIPTKIHHASIINVKICEGG